MYDHNDVKEYIEPQTLHTSIINKFIEHKNYSKYLEIGVEYGNNFKRVNADIKISVDPVQYGATTVVMTSDDYFAQLPEDEKFDLIFIDGLHEHEQCYRDIENSIKHLSATGMIICHDMNPIREDMLVPGGEWTGDVYKALLRTASDHRDVTTYLIEDADYGIGIITQVKNKNVEFDWNVDLETYHRIKYDHVNVLRYVDFERVFGFNLYTICAIAKQEYDYICDWIDYHLNIGYDKIVIYDNNDPDGERYDELLRDFIADDRVEIRDARGAVAVQQEVYNEYYRESAFKWTTIIDLDEFVTFTPESPYQDIKSFISMYEDSDAYMIPWVCERPTPSDFEGPIYNYNNPLPHDARNITFVPHNLNEWHKTIYKAGSFKDVWLSEHIPSILNFEGYHIYDESGMWLYSQPVFMSKYKDTTAINCYLRHYITRDIKTFFYKKYLRGHAGMAGWEGISGRTDGIENCRMGWTQNLNYYTSINRTITDEEQEFLLSKGFKLNPTFFPDVYIIVDTPDDDKYIKEIEGIIWELKRVCYPIEVVFNRFNDDMTNFDLPNINTTPDINRKNYLIQKPIIVHIGYPIMRTDIDVYIQELKNSILNPDKFIQICRMLVMTLEDEMILYSTPESLRYDENNLGWSSIISAECDKLRLSNKYCFIDGNTFVTNLKTYNHILNNLSISNILNKDIKDYWSQGITTRYHRDSIMLCNIVETIMWYR